LAQQVFVGGKTPFSAVAQTVGFDLGKSKMLYLSMEIDGHSLRQLAQGHLFSARPERPISSSASSKIDARFGRLFYHP
jgi:hypothetical protein